ncbi:MAG: AIR synthase-related protein [Chitinophagales bacterium]
MSQDSNYDNRGVSAAKPDVHNAIKDLDMGLYPKAFSKIYPDYLAGDENYCNLMSSDGTGTKSIIAYLYYKETGDASVFRNISTDVLVMNLDDLLCVGAKGPFLYSSILNRNKHLISGEIIKELIAGAQEFMDTMLKFGVDIKYLGGETADLGDTVRTLTVDGSMTTRMPKSDLVITSNIKAGNVIVGIASYGKATYEKEYNSGIGSNGLTSARHDVLNKEYLEKYPETFDPNTDKQYLYIGSKKLTDELEGTPLNVGKALLSPTRSYAPLMHKILEEMPGKIDSLVHNTGGALSKVLHFIDDVRVVKDNIFETPPIFDLIQKESGTSWEEMYTVFNMGQRMEVYLNKKDAQQVIDICKTFDIDAQIIGYVEACDKAEVIVDCKNGVFTYN